MSKWQILTIVMISVILSGPAQADTIDIVDVYSDGFEYGIYSCVGPYGDSFCWTDWTDIDPTGSGMPVACDGNTIAWHEFETCNYPNGPDHLLIMDGARVPEHNMTGYTDLAVKLDWYLNSSIYGETIEIWVADAPFSTLDCSVLSPPWEMIYSETNQLSYNLGECGEWSVPLPASYDNATQLIVAVRYLGMDGDSVGLDSLTLVGDGPPVITPTPEPTPTTTPSLPPVPATSHIGVVLMLLGCSAVIFVSGHTRKY